MTKYIIRVNNDGAEGMNLQEVKDELVQLLDSGFYTVEKVLEVPELGNM